MAAHDAELDQLDDQKEIVSLNKVDVRPNCKPIALTMKYKYSRLPDCTIKNRKARCYLRGDLMRPIIQYGPNSTAAYAVGKSTIRVIYAIAAVKQLPLLQLYITSAFTTEEYSHVSPVYVK